MADSDHDRFHERKHPRLSQYDYSVPNYYFVTICTHAKQCIFGKLDQRNPYGLIADSAFAEIERHFSGVVIDKYVVMPNHVHAIVVLKNSRASLSVIIGQYKAYVTKQIHAIDPLARVWQTSFHDHIIRNQQGYEKIWAYIEHNPTKWEEDCFFSNQAAPL